MTEVLKNGLLFSLTIGDTVFERDVAADMKLDPDDLDRMLIEHPSIYAYYSAITQKANLLLADAIFQYEKSIAEFSKVAREELDDSSKRVTDKQISAVIDSMPKIQALRKIVIQREHESKTMIGFLRALEHKKECLMQICNNRRKELDQLGTRVMATKRSEPPLGAESARHEEDPF